MDLPPPPDYETATKFVYIFVRKDLDVTYRIIQVGHVCLELGASLSQSKVRDAHFCLLEVENERELMRAAKYMTELGIPFSDFYEPDHSTGYTALATEPLIGEHRRPFERFRMYRDETEELHRGT